MKKITIAIVGLLALSVAGTGARMTGEPDTRIEARPRGRQCRPTRLRGLIMLVSVERKSLMVLVEE
jgi:hypothetical protein